MASANTKTTGTARTRKSDAKSPKNQTASVADKAAEGSEHSVVMAPHGKRVLVAEDNKVTQDLLKLLLQQRGHEVHIVGNGQDALKALAESRYDVVLMDFHLPKMDGVKVATAFRAGVTEDHQPRFVAITADVEGLLGHVDSCENFDNVLPKPFDLERVVQVVEGKEEEIYVPRAVQNAQAKLQTIDIAPANDVGASNPIQSLGHEFLRWPDDFTGDRLSDQLFQAVLDDAGQFDAVLLKKPATLPNLTAIWATKGLHVLPVLDLTGAVAGHADLDGSKLSFGETGKVADLIADFHNNRTRLHSDLLYTDDLGLKLLGRTFVSGTALAPHYDASVQGLVSYNVTLPGNLVEQEAVHLCETGYLEREFFDRFHQCGACGSSRLHVREECNSCRSPNLREEAYLHHFTCAYQGPESDFRHGDDLVCPKCRKEVAHFGVDYDKPGSMMRCDSCHHVNADALVGFVCLDCSAHTDSEMPAMRDVFAYELSDSGTGYLETGRPILGRQNRALWLSHLPLEVIVAVNNELKAYQGDHEPFVVLDISYANQRRIEHEHGLREFEQARDLFLENLNNTLRKDDLVIKGIAYDYAILKGIDTEEAKDGLTYLRTEATNGVRHDLGIAVQVFSPEDFA